MIMGDGRDLVLHVRVSPGFLDKLDEHIDKINGDERLWDRSKLIRSLVTREFSAEEDNDGG
jgi:hypothetical protein